MSMDTTSSQCQVMIMGAPLNPLVSNNLVSTEVDSTMFVPSQFRLVFMGMPDTILLPGGLQLATPVTVAVSSTGVPTPLLTGEVTAVEVDHSHGETLTIVRGMDRSHRLMRGTKTMAYPEMTASDVVTMLLGEAGVIPGQIIPTTNTYPWLSQANVSSWVFIQQLAALENYVAYADALGLFNFCPMPTPEAGMPPAMTYMMPQMGTQLVLGKNLVRLRAVVSGAEQVPAVTVTGYDPTLTVPVIGPFPTIPSASQSIDPATLPPVVGGEFGATPFFDASVPFDNEGGAMSWARSIAGDIAGVLSELEGECLGNPGLLAGKSITIGMAGMPFDGYYICSAARHVFEPSNAGYTTWITVGGFQDRSLFALSSGATRESNRPTIPGLVIGTVVNNMDPKNQGQVQVMFPWLAPSYISAWARVMQIGASKVGGGFLWVPEIGDEVLIGFDRGSIDHPFVIGNLYNGVASPLPPPSVDGVVANRRIASRMAHTIQWNDGPEAMGISIMTAPVENPPTSVVLDGEQIKITVNSLGQVEITGALGVKVTAMGGPLTLDGLTVSIGGDTATQVSIGGPATTSLSLAGMSVSIGGPEGAPAGSIGLSGASVNLGPG
jgi:hypothetical protein